jgi:hypothetical protein
MSGFLGLPDASMAQAGNFAMMNGGGKIYQPKGGYGKAADAAIASGMAFLTAELEKIDPKIREPLTSVTWQRDIVAKTGGGWVEYTSTFDTSYATSGANQHGIVGSATNAVPIIQVDVNKNLFPVLTWMNVLKVKFVDMQKSKQIGRNLEDLMNKGVRLNYNKTLDMNVYTGFTDYGTTGLLNDPNVTVTSVATGAGGTTAWNTKTPDEILQDVNDMLVAGWTASEYDMKGMPNHILITPEAYAYIGLHKVSQAADKSILEYLLENNIAKRQGVDVSIEPCRWCKGAGAGGTDRAMAYVNDEDMVYYDITVPNTRAMTQPDLLQAAYLTLYAAQMGPVKFNYFQPVGYFDGI